MPLISPIYPSNTPPDGIAPPAQVTVGTVDFTDDAKYTEAEPNTVWDDFLVNSYYYQCPHTYAMSVSSPVGFQGDTCAFVKIATTTLLWVVDWTSAMVGRQPVSPDPTPPQGWVLLDQQLCPLMISVMADGVTPSYRLSGTYLYGCRRPQEFLSNNVVYPLPPWLQDAFERGQPRDRMQTGISAPPGDLIRQR